MIIKGHNFKLWRIIVFVVPTFVTYVIGMWVECLLNGISICNNYLNDCMCRR